MLVVGARRTTTILLRASSSERFDAPHLPVPPRFFADTPQTHRPSAPARARAGYRLSARVEPVCDLWPSVAARIGLGGKPREMVWFSRSLRARSLTTARKSICDQRAQLDRFDNPTH